MSVSILIDKKKPFPFGPANRKQLIATGKHKISFIPNDPKRFIERTWRINIPPGKTPYHFRGRLNWRSAKLLVQSNVPAVVTVPGRGVGKANNKFDIGIKNGPMEQVSVLVSADGYIPETRKVTISAGEVAQIKVTLISKNK